LKKYFLSFASSDLNKSLIRIKKEAEELKFYNHILTLSEEDLDISFKMKFENYLKFGTRGYGYMCWKPQIILQGLNKMEEGDVLQYTDVGCQLNKKGIKRLSEYFELTKNSEKGILAFQNKIPEYPLNYDGRKMLICLDYEWTKGDLIDYFKVRDNENILKTPTIGSGIIFIRKCEKSLEIINRWLDVIKYDFKLIDDSKSRCPNVKGFIEHRHDQAIFSILCKLNNIKTISAFEYWYSSKNNANIPDWSMLSNFPIWAKRDKSYKFKSNFMINIWRIKKFIKKIINIHLLK